LLLLFYFEYILGRYIRQMIYILYGSQTGNAESIAKDLGTQCQDMEIGNMMYNIYYYDT